MPDMIETKVEELGLAARIAGAAAFIESEGDSDREGAWFAWVATQEDTDSWSNKVESTLEALFAQGWNGADAEANLTEEERLWCAEYAKRLGLGPLDWTFDGDVWRERVQQITFILKKEEQFYLAGEERRSLGFSPTFVMRLCRFKGADRPDGWCAFLSQGRARTGFLQGNSEPKPKNICHTPAEAVEEIVRKLRNKAQKRQRQALQLRNALYRVT